MTEWTRYGARAPSSTWRATSIIRERVAIAVFWMKPKASDSDMPDRSISTPLAPSTSRRVSSLSSALACWSSAVGGGLLGLGVDGPLLLAAGHGLVDGRDELDALERLDQDRRPPRPRGPRR